MLALAMLIAASSMNASADARDIAMHQPREDGASSTLTIDTMPYARTVTCGSYTLTGSASGGGAVSWSASPSGASGSCTGTTSWSCVVSVAPDASGEGVETITVSQSGGATDTVTIGFFVNGSHSCFLAQSVDGDYNSTLANLDAVATWENLGSSALDVTQGTAANQPTFRTAIVGGQPVVRCDGGDLIAASTASDWTFISNGGDFSFEHVSGTTSPNPNALYVLSSTATALATSSIGFALFGDDRSGIASDRARANIYNSTGTASITVTSSDNVWPSAKISLISFVLDDNGGAGDDAFQRCNGAACGTAARAASYSASSPNAPLTICALPSATTPFSGDLFALRIYQSALSSTQLGINKAVDEWALGGTLPVTP